MTNQLDVTLLAPGATLEINGRVKMSIFYCATIRLGPSASIEGQLKRVARELVIEDLTSGPTEPSNVQQLPKANGSGS